MVTGGEKLKKVAEDAFFQTAKMDKAVKKALYAKK